MSGRPALRGQPVYTEAVLVERQVCCSEADRRSWSATWSKTNTVGTAVYRLSLVLCVLNKAAVQAVVRGRPILKAVACIKLQNKR